MNGRRTRLRCYYSGFRLSPCRVAMDSLPLEHSELETTRSPEDLKNWCIAKIEEIARVKGGVNAVRMSRGLCKPLVEEVYPLSIWACSSDCVSKQALISPCVGSQPYDALVKDTERQPEQYRVEITQAHMGQTEHFRMLHLEQERWAPGPLSEVTREGGRGGKLKPGRSLNSMEGVVSKTRSLIREAVEAKIAKEYAPPIALLVTFEDFIVKDEPHLTELLREDIACLVRKAVCPFFRVFLVGMSERILISIDTET